jgi:hypothetical protein
MEINFIKALPTGEEPDFVLISRTTQSSQPGSDSMMQQQLAKVVNSPCLRHTVLHIFYPHFDMLR